MKALYPSIQCYAKHQVKVSTLHTLYVEESGNPNGLPVLFIHGGPGSGCSADSRRFFDPELYRIVIFDQRLCDAICRSIGLGKAQPFFAIDDEGRVTMLHTEISKIVRKRGRRRCNHRQVNAISLVVRQRHGRAFTGQHFSCLG